MQWHNVGHERNIRFLTVAEVETIHAELVADFSSQPDPIFPPGVKSKHLLASAVFHPHTALGESHKYPTVEMSAAAMLHAIVHNHPFHNGNKRTALVSMLVFLDKNGLIITCDEDEIFRIVLRLGKHGLVASDAGDLADREILEIAEWIRGHSRLIRSGEKPLPFRKLWQLLIARDCAIDGHGSSGSKVNISRTVLTRKPWWNPRSGKKTLRTQVHYIGEGREMSVGTISKIRCDLELDETHGVDSAAFYEDSPTSPSTFIEQYRKTLDRLAGL